MNSMSNNPHVTIIGSGVGGMCMAMQLMNNGSNNFTILEKADDIGGTWRDNEYPGCACDVPSHFYSFSFETRGDWSRVYPPREEIHAYLSNLADKYHLRRNTRFNSELASASFDEKSQKWTLKLTNGDTLTTDIVVTARKFPKLRARTRLRAHCFIRPAGNMMRRLKAKRSPLSATVPRPRNLFLKSPNWLSI